MPRHKTLHDAPLPRKRPNRFWLYAPYVVVLAVAGLWSLAWIGIRVEVEEAMDKTAARLRDAGYVMEWKDRRIDGYPFRVDVTLDQPRIAEPSGWGLAAPQIKAEAYVYHLDHWIVAATQGVVLSRPNAGAVVINGQALRASYVWLPHSPPRVSVEGVKLAFTPQPGAKPFFITSADRLGLHLRPADGDKAEFVVQLDGASLPLQGLLARIAQNRPIALICQGTASNVSALHGHDWPSAVQAWTAAGGGVDIDRSQVTAGPAVLAAGQSRLTVGEDGRLRGTLGLDLRQAPGAVQAMAEANGIDPTVTRSAMAVAQALSGGQPIAHADVVFQAGVTTFGPVAIGPAPKVY
jgi:hypothetical protein